MMQEQQSSASGALLGELIKIIRQEAAPGGSAMTFAAEKTFTLEGIGIPDTTLAREITQFVRGYRAGAAVPSFEPRLLLGCARRKASWPQVRLRASLCGSDVSRHGPHSCPQQRPRALRGRRRERRSRLP